MHEKSRGKFEDVKFRAMVDAEASGVTDPAEREKIGEEAKRQEIFKVGRESEQRFCVYIQTLESFNFLREATHEEDIEQGIDYWVGYKHDMRLPDLPVQVKSSEGDIKVFLKDPRYLRRGGLMMVFNTGPSVTLGNFNRQHEEEVGRIREILKQKKIKFL